MTIEGAGDNRSRSIAPPHLLSDEAVSRKVVAALKVGDKVEQVFKRVESQRRAEKQDAVAFYENVYKELEGIEDKSHRDHLEKNINALILGRLLPRRALFGPVIPPYYDNRERASAFHLLCNKDPISVLNNAETFNVVALPLDERIALFKAAIRKERTQEVLSYFSMLQLQEAPLEQRIEIGNIYINIYREQFNMLGFVNDAAKCEDVDSRMDFCLKIAEQGAWGARGIADNLETLNLSDAPFAKRFELLKLITDKSSLSKEQVQALGFDKDIQSCPNAKERIVFCKKFEDNAVVAWLDHNFTELGFIKDLADCENIESRIVLADQIMQLGSWAVHGLANNFDKAGFREGGFEQRLEICNKLAAKLVIGRFFKTEEPVVGRELQEGFEKLGFIQDIQNNPDIQSKLSLCRKLIAQGSWAGIGIVNHFSQLGLEEATSQEQYELIKSIAALGEFAGQAVAWKFNDLRLYKATPAQRVELYHLLLEQGWYSESAIIDKFSDVTDGMSIEERLLLGKFTAALGANAAERLAGQFVNLGFENATPSQRFELCSVIAEQGELPATRLAQTMKDLELTSSQSFQLSKKIAMQGPEAAKALVEKRGLLRMKEASSAQLHEFLSIVRGSDYSFDENSLEKIAGGPFLERLALELFLYPEGLKSGELAWHSDLEALAPLFSILVFQGGTSIEVEKNIDDLALFIGARSQLSSLGEVLQQIKAIPSLSTKVLLTRWLAYTAGLLQQLTSDQLQILKTTSLMNDILHFRNPEMRFALVRQLCEVVQQPAHLLQMKPKNDFSRLSSIILSRFMAAGMPPKTAEQIVGIIDSKKKLFMDTKNANDLLQLLNLIVEQSPFSEAEVKLVSDHLVRVLNRDNNKDIIKDIRILNALLEIFGRDRFFQTLSKNEAYEEAFLKGFQALFDVGHIDNFAEKYEKTFGKFRQSQALFYYLRSVNKLPKNEQEEVKQLLNQYVVAVLNNQFPSVRYDTSAQPHLDHIFTKRPDIHKAWLKRAPPSAIETKAPANQTIDYKTFLKHRMNHLDADKFPFLMDFVEGREVNFPVDSDEAQFQNHLIQICKDPKNVEKHLNAIAALQLSLGEFENDLKAMRPKKEISNLAGYQVMETNDPCDLLLIGTEISGSCQRVNGDPKLNKCLASYLMQGEISVVAVKNPNGVLVARSVLRLFWDDKNNVPVLLQERLYSNSPNPDIIQAVHQAAIDKAKALGVALVSNEEGAGDPYEGTVKFLGGPAPFTYSDASGGVHTGPFETKDTHILYQPPAMRRL